MPDELTPPPQPENIVVERAQPKVYSPSPDPGMPQPKRRTEDTKNYVGEWAVLIIALLGWAVTFTTDMAAYEEWSQILTPKFIGLHSAQLFSVTVAVLAAKRIR